MRIKNPICFLRKLLLIIGGVLLLICSKNILAQDKINGKLPSVLIFNNGKNVVDKKQWIKRRTEILNIFKEEMFGESPTAPVKIRYKITEDYTSALNAKALRRQVRIFFDDGNDIFFMDLLVYYPATKNKLFPVFVGYNFAGNQSITSDKAVKITASWISAKTKGVLNNRATDSTRGIAKNAWPLEEIIARGYAVATIYAGDVDADFDDGNANGLQSLYPKLQQQQNNFSTIAAWGWGLSRAMDYLEKDRLADRNKIIVIGTSRMAKAALWAGANDKRFAVVISNESGAGGAKLFHHIGGENTQNICKRFPYWFSKKFLKYCGKDTLLPFDQHMLLALIAPRPLYVASAQGSVITDSYGEFLSAKYADPVYKMLGTSGLFIKTFPEVNKPSFGKIGYHLRTGGHDILWYDWEQFILFCNKHLNHKI